MHQHFDGHLQERASPWPQASLDMGGEKDLNLLVAECGGEFECGLALVVPLVDLRDEPR